MVRRKLARGRGDVGLDALEPRRLYTAVPSGGAGVGGPPDLTIASFAVTPLTDVAPGGPVQCALQVPDSASVPYGTKLSFFISSDATLSPDDALVTSFSALAGPYAYAPIFGIYLPGVAPGAYHFIAVIDADNTVAESDESNNTFVSNLFNVLPPTDDLSASSISVTDAVTSPGGGLSLTGTFSSTGPAGMVYYYLSSDDVAGNADDIPLVGSVFISSADQTQTGTFQVPRSIAPGEYHLVARIDPFDDLRETDETNNAVVGPAVSVSSAPAVPDLAALGYAVGGTNFEAGASMYTVGTFANFGAYLSGTVHYKVYLSADQSVSADDALIGSQDAPLRAYPNNPEQR